MGNIGSVKILICSAFMSFEFPQEDYEYAADDAITTTASTAVDDGTDHSNNQSNVPNTNGKQFTCNICDKKFNRAPNLSKHRKNVHRAILSHACSQCGRRFAFAEDLQYHMIYHTGERRYCDLCDKSFICSSTLNKHKKNVHQKLREFAVIDVVSDFTQLLNSKDIRYCTICI